MYVLIYFLISQIVKELVDLISNSFPVILYMVKYISINQQKKKVIVIN